MHISYLKVGYTENIYGKYKNLSDFEIFFDKPISVIIGRNGAGKSNILEAISLIFSGLFLKEMAYFDFEICYFCKGNPITVKALRGEIPNITIDGEKYVSRDNRAFINEILPDAIIAYYSGNSERLHGVFQEYEEMHAKKLRKGINEKFSLFYHKHFQYKLFLVALLSSELDSIKSLLEDDLKINLDDSIHLDFIFQDPGWNRKGGFENFWGAEGVLLSFFQKIKGLSSSPLSDIAFDHVIGIGDLRQLRDLRDFCGYESNLFSYLNDAYYSGILKDVRIFLSKGGVRCEDVDFSEGEKQIIAIEGLAQLLESKEALYLMDEPDNFLHPEWQKKFLPRLADSQNWGTLATESGDGITTESGDHIMVNAQPGTHFVITTHSPLIIGSAQNIDVIGIESEAGKLSTICHTKPELYGENQDGIDFVDIYGNQSEYILKKVFGIDNSRANAFNERLQKLHSLLSERANGNVSTGIEREIGEIREEIEHYLGDDYSDRELALLSTEALVKLFKKQIV